MAMPGELSTAQREEIHARLEQALRQARSAAIDAGAGEVFVHTVVDRARGLCADRTDPDD